MSIGVEWENRVWRERQRVSVCWGICMSVKSWLYVGGEVRCGLWTGWGIHVEEEECVCVEPEFCEWRSRLCLRKKICWGSGERNEGTCVVYRWGVEGETGLWIFVYVDRRVYVSV